MKQFNKHTLIEKKLAGTLNQEETEAFNRLMKTDVFFRESIEGYQSMQSNGDELNVLDKKYKKSSIIKPLLISSVSIAAAVAFFFIIGKTIKTDKLYTPREISPIICAYNNSNAPIIVQPNFDTIKETEEITEESIHQILSESKPSMAFETVQPMFKLQPQVIEQLKKEKTIEHWTAKSNHLFGYIHQLKFVDYRVDNRKNSSNFTIPSNRDLPQEQNSNIKREEIAYIDFLEQALLKFKNRNYENALDDFRTILNQYPNDINALFYAGLCHYYTNSKECIAIMERVGSHEINTFKYDAQWYQAMAYKHENMKTEAVRLLTAISESNSYYGAMAHDELKQLKDLR